MLKNTQFVVMAALAWSSDLLSAGAEETPVVETYPASSLGNQAMTCVGRIQPRGEPTTYCFEHGTAPEFGRQTSEQQLPPRLAAYYHET